MAKGIGGEEKRAATGGALAGGSSPRDITDLYGHYWALAARYQYCPESEEWSRSSASLALSPSSWTDAPVLSGLTIMNPGFGVFERPLHYKYHSRHL